LMLSMWTLGMLHAQFDRREPSNAGVWKAIRRRRRREDSQGVAGFLSV
jgi:hypothetical protein